MENNLLEKLIEQIESEPYHMGDLSEAEIVFIEELVELYKTEPKQAQKYAHVYKELINNKIDGVSL